ncbi:MAG: HAD family phosphatase [Deltaproteobacteria bacterium]|nr:MAG: HAD family phosphatase [Deltaproteobacteria bacterium]
MSLRAILFDFDGVIVNSEPIHLEKLQILLAEEGILLTKEDYYKNYLGYDDRDCLHHVFLDQNKVLTPEKKESLIQRKLKMVMEAFDRGEIVMPDVKAFIQKVTNDYYCAIVSGAHREEIISILEGCGLRKHFKIIIGSEDVAKSKPDPEGYKKAMQLLNRDFVPTSEILLPAECLVIEDSPWGITAGKKAGAVCVGITNTYNADRLFEADFVVNNFSEIDLKSLVE